MGHLKWGKLWKWIVVERGQSRYNYNGKAGPPAGFSIIGGRRGSIPVVLNQFVVGVDLRLGQRENELFIVIVKAVDVQLQAFQREEAIAFEAKFAEAFLDKVILYCSGQGA